MRKASLLLFIQIVIPAFAWKNVNGLFAQMPAISWTNQPNLISPDIPYFIVSRKCGKVLNVYSPNGDGTGCNNGEKIQLFSKTDHNASKWILEPASTSAYFIKSYKCGKVLNLSSPGGDGTGCKNEGTIQLWDQSDCNCSLWELVPTGLHDGSFFISAKNCGKTLNVYSPMGDGTGCNDGTKIQVYDKVDANASMWLLVPASSVRPKELILTTDSIDYWENTAETVPPMANKCGGGIVINVGRGENYLNLPFSAYSGSTAPPPVVSDPLFSLTPPNGVQLGTDNQVVKTANGDLIMMKHACFSSSILPALGFEGENYIIWGGKPVKSARGGMAFFKSTDCGKTWTYLSGIDAAKFGNGKFAWPRPANFKSQILNYFDLDTDIPFSKQYNYPDGKGKLWWLGDFDRDELYVCPFTGIMYVTTQYVSGPFLKQLQTKLINEPQRTGSLIFYSLDNGSSWRIWKELDQSAPIVMTSTPDGRIFMLYYKGSQAYIRYSVHPMKKGMSIDEADNNILSPRYPVTYKPAGNGLPLSMPVAIDTVVNIGRPFAFLSISRANLNGQDPKVRVAYQYLDKNQRQGVAFVLISVQGDGTPLMENIGVIESESPGKSSVFFGNFTETDFNSSQNVINTDISVFYWIEASIKGQPNRFAAKYCVFSGEKGMGTPQLLSTDSPNYWTEVTRVGDYLSGSFFEQKNELNFFCQWKTGKKINANIVTIPFMPAINGKTKAPVFKKMEP